MTREKATSAERADAAKACVEGRTSAREAARRLGVGETRVHEWIARYKAHGAEAFQEQEHNTVYSNELKTQAVREYIEGENSQREVAAKYGLRSAGQLRNWIKVYNSGGNFRYRMSGGSRMKQGRDITQKERIAIAMDCLENRSNFGVAAIKYNVSYQQVHSWVRKFKEQGEAGLEDRRGKRIAEQEPRTELEKAQTEIARLKHELYMAKMERDLLDSVYMRSN